MVIRAMPMLQQTHDHWIVQTPGRRFIDLTPRIRSWLKARGFQDGLLTVFIPHTSASLTIQENTDPDVLTDLTDALAAIAPEDGKYRHRMEGPDDMPAHIKAMLTLTSVSVPVIASEPAFGLWQALYLIEHRRAGHSRQVIVHYVGT